MKEISRKISSNMYQVIARRPCRKPIVCEEVRLMEAGVTKYLTAAWTGETAGELECHVTGKPIFDYLLMDDISDAEFHELEMIRRDDELEKFKKKDKFAELLERLKAEFRIYLTANGFVNPQNAGDFDSR